MRSVLLGNGINIQFGGKAYTSSYIMQRIKYRARLDAYKKLFADDMTANDIIKMLEAFVEEANKLKNDKNYSDYAEDSDSQSAIKDFQERYKDWEISKPEDVMLEDWFLLVHVFFLKNRDLEEQRQAGIQGFQQLILDAIYNNGRIQEIYKSMSSYRKVNRHFKAYDNIFTINYDDNMECLTGKRVYHLHGDFSELADSENEKTITGYLRNKKGECVVQEDMKHVFCNALLNYSGMLKKRVIDENYNKNLAGEQIVKQYATEEKCRESIRQLKEKDPVGYERIITKIENPELYVATPYYFDVFEQIEDELDIIGVSPNNDAHIFKTIVENTKLKKVIFFYKEPKERQYVEENYPKELFECVHVDSLWDRLRCNNNIYINYPMPPRKEIQKFIEIYNKMSESECSVDDVIKAVKGLTQKDINRICAEINNELSSINPNHISVNYDEFRKENAAISYVGLQEGIPPTAAYIVCMMGEKKR